MASAVDPAPRRRARAAAFVIALGAWHLAPARARAQSAPDGDSVAALFATGVEAVQHQRWEDARRAFAAAYELDPRPAVLFNLAGAQAQTGHLVLAAESYRRFLREASGATAETYAAAATQALAVVEPRVPRLRVEPRGVVPGDEITLDGAIVSAASIESALAVDPGGHTLRVVRARREIAHYTVRVSESESRTVVVDVRSLAVAIGLSTPGGGPHARGTVPRAPGGGVLASPWFWLGASVVLTAGAVVAGLAIATSVDAPPRVAVPGNVSPAFFVLQ